MEKRGPKPKGAGGPLLNRGNAATPVAIPAYLGTVAKEQYARVVTRLQEAGTLGTVDPMMIEMYSNIYSLAKQARETLDRDGVTSHTKDGRVLPHPMIAVLNAATTRLIRLSHVLGLSRNGAGGVDQDHDDKWADLLKITG